MTGAAAASRGSAGHNSDEPEVLPVEHSAVSRDRSEPIVARGACSSPESHVGVGLSDAMSAVAAFHAAFDLPRQLSPSLNVSDELAQLRVDLLVEEVGEFADATKRRDLVAMADALGDIVYVAYGAAVTYGMDLDAVLAEIHRSNMSKLGADGRPLLREDGKVLKSSRYRPPDVARVLAEQPDLRLPHKVPWRE